mgnify:CR=1 FL=1
MLTKYLIVFLISMVPLIELRGAMVYAAVAGMPFLPSLICCVIGIILPVPFLIKFAKAVLFYLSKIDKIGWLFQKIIDRGNEKAVKVRKAELLGLFAFVAIPLPGTGGWTGALIAALMDLRMKKCLPIIALGVFIAGLIMSLITYGIF